MQSHGTSPTESSGYYVHHPLQLKKMCTLPRSVFMYSYDPSNKQNLFPYSGFNGWLLKWRQRVLCDVGTELLKLHHLEEIQDLKR